MSIIVTIAFGLSMLTGDQAYPAMEATNQYDTCAAFEFPSNRAAADDPARTLAKGRKLAEEDREYPTDRQRYWLSVNVGKNLNFTDLEQVICKPKWATAEGRCDRYAYTDAPGAVHDFFFYINS